MCNKAFTDQSVIPEVNGKCNISSRSSHIRPIQIPIHSSNTSNINLFLANSFTFLVIAAIAKSLIAWFATKVISIPVRSEALNSVSLITTGQASACYPYFHDSSYVLAFCIVLHFHYDFYSCTCSMYVSIWSVNCMAVGCAGFVGVLSIHLSRLFCKSKLSLSFFESLLSSIL